MPGLSGTTWVSLMMRNSTGSSPSFSAISSMAISSAIMPGASPGARIAFASGRSSTARRVAVSRFGARIERARLHDRCLGPAAGQIAGPALMPDGGDLAVPGRADADALDRRRAVHGVVGDQGARQRHLHRPLGRAGAERRKHRVGAQPQLGAETAADDTAISGEPSPWGCRASWPGRPASSRSSGWRSRP